MHFILQSWSIPMLSRYLTVVSLMDWIPVGTQQDYYSLQKHCLVSMERLTSISTHYSSDVIQQIEEGSCHIDVSKCPPCDTYINNHLLTLDKIKLCSDTLYCAAVTWKWLFFFFYMIQFHSLLKKNHYLRRMWPVSP